MGEFSFQYPLSFIFFCIACGIGLALLLYYKVSTWNDRPWWYKLILSALRFFSGTAIAFLLLNPLFKNYKQEVKKPILAMLEDRSKSMIAKDSSWIQQYEQDKQTLINRLQEKYELKSFSFGNESNQMTTSGYQETRSNIYAGLDAINESVDVQNLKGIILHSDGIYNSGRNPIYHPLGKLAPIYPILHGDTIPEKDLTIQRVYNNEIIYSGDKFSIQVDLRASHCKDEKTVLQVFKIESGQSKKVYESVEKINANPFFVQKEIVLDAPSPGLQKYKIQVSAIHGERNVKNNAREIYIDVLDAKKKVLIYALSPHPDINAIKEAILSNKNYEVEIKFYPELPTNVDKYALIIYHQLPGYNAGITSTVDNLKKQKIPMIYIIGNQTDLLALNTLQDAVTISGNAKNQNESQAVLNAGFTLFTQDETMRSSILKYPPLSVPFGNFKIDGSTSIFLFQKIGKVETNYPLWIFQDKAFQKTSILLGEGLWNWRMNDFAMSNSFNHFDELISKTVLYVISKDDKRKFRINFNKKLYEESESIIATGELYNDSYEKVNEPEVQVEIKSKDNKSYSFSMGKKDNYYELNAGSLPANEYRYKATCNWSNKTYSAEGYFGVEAYDMEADNLLADHQLLRGMADQSGGQAYAKANINALSELLLNDKSSKSILYQNLDIRPLLNEKWLFFLIALCLIAEWFLRRFWGSY